MPVFYDLYGLEDGTEKTELQKYLYCVFPKSILYGCRYVLSIERDVFVKLVKDEKLQKILDSSIKKIYFERKKLLLEKTTIKCFEKLQYRCEDIIMNYTLFKDRKKRESDEKIKNENEENKQQAKQFLQNEENKTKSNVNTPEQLPTQTKTKKYY